METFNTLLQPPYTLEKLENLELLSQFTTTAGVNLSESAPFIAQPVAVWLSRNSSLDYLNLSGNPVGDSGARALRPSTLRHLILRNSNIGNAGAEALANNASLIFLHLSGNHAITDDEALARAFEQNRTLRMIELNDTNVGDLVAQALARSTTLRTVDLSRTLVTDVGAQAFEFNHSIRKLYLGRWRHGSAPQVDITDETARALSRNQTLLHIHLNCVITDVAAVALANSISLQDFWIPERGITDIGIQAIRNSGKTLFLI